MTPWSLSRRLGSTRHRGRFALLPTALVAAALACVGALPRLAWPHGSVTTTVLFDREVASILSSKCVACHMDGGPAFPLETYDQVWRRRLDIRRAVLRRQMPPWPAVPGYGHFTNDNGLTLREQQFLIAWVEGLGPRNAGSVFLNVADATAQPVSEIRATAHVGHWQLGTPTLERPVVGSTTVTRHPDGSTTQRVDIDLGLTTTRRVRAIEFRPRDRRSLAGATFRLKGTGQWLGAWTPWHESTELPGDAVHILPAGAHVLAELRLRDNATTVDMGTIGIYDASRDQASVTSELVVRSARTTTGRSRGAVRVTRPTRVWAIAPTGLSGVAALSVTARYPDGRADVLLLSRDPQDAWPTPFLLRSPATLPAGTRIVVDAQHRVDRGPGVRLTIGHY